MLFRSGVLGVSVAQACAGPSRKKKLALVLQNFQVVSAKYLGYQKASKPNGVLALQLEDIPDSLRCSSAEVVQQLDEDSSADLASFRASRRSEND